MVPTARIAAAALATLALGAGLGGGGCGEDAAPATAVKTPASLPHEEAAALYRDYGTLKGAARLEKYGAGVVVKGAVTKRVNLGEAEGIQLWLAGDDTGPAHIAARFQDNGAQVVKKKVQPGEIVSLRCQIGGKPAEVLFLLACVLE